MKKLEKENKMLKLKLDIAESDNQRKDKIIAKQDAEIDETKKENEALKKELIELKKKLDLTIYEKNYYFSKLNNVGTNAGIPTSQTPINKKKVIPNSRKNTGGKIGGKINHPKSKLEKFKEEEINENEDVTLDECPHCHTKELIKLDSEITKDEFDYQIKIIKKRIHFKEYKCPKCNKIVRKNIPVKLKEENQYCSNVQATALTLTNIGNVPMNKVRKIICGLTMNDIDLSEGYIAKL